MVETISPVVHGGRARWLGTLALHALGATTAAASFGALLGGIGAMLGAPWHRPGLLVLAVLSGVYALAALTRLPVPVPQLRRQVPDWWRTFFGRPFAAMLYGAGLGIGFLTYLANGTLVVVAFAAAAGGRPVLGAVLLGPFGLVRGLSAAVSWRSVTQEQSQRLVDRLAATSDAVRRIANGTVLVLVALAAVTVRDRVASDPWALLVAVLACVFAWAAISKFVARRRWVRALTAHELSPKLTRVSIWAVPVAEGLVPILVVIGSPRLAAIWSTSLLAAFSLTLARTGRRIGDRVPCGCLGGLGVVRVRVALARNLALFAVAALVFAHGSDASWLSLPRSPALGDGIPLTLTVGTLVASVLVVWRASVWFARGRGA